MKHIILVLSKISMFMGKLVYKQCSCALFKTFTPDQNVKASVSRQNTAFKCSALTSSRLEISAAFCVYAGADTKKEPFYFSTFFRVLAKPD